MTDARHRLTVRVVTPAGEALSASADEITLPGARGELGFLPGHTHLLTALQPGVLAVRDGAALRVFAVNDGFAEIEDDLVTVLTDTCEDASAIDLDRAKRALADSEARLGAIGPEDPDYLDHQRRVARARGRLLAARAEAPR